MTTGRTTWRPLLLAGLLCALQSGCASYWREQADTQGYTIVRATQLETLGRDEPFTVEPAANTLRRRLLLDQVLPRSGPASLGAEELAKPEHWPEESMPAVRKVTPLVEVPPAGPLRLSLVEALQLAARNNRTYQQHKENIFQAALDLDLQSEEFRSTFIGTLETLWSNDLTDPHQRVKGLDHTGTVGWELKLKTGAKLTANLALDLVHMLTADEHNAFGILADVTVTIPLLRGAGEYVVTEPLTQAQRDVVYALLRFLRYRKSLAVDVAEGYLGVLRQADTVENTAENYRSLIAQTRRARRLAEANRLPEIQVDQARQNELSARNRWISARQNYQAALDSFKLTLGLPTDADIRLDPTELRRLAENVEQHIAIDGDSGASPATQPASQPASQPTSRPTEGDIDLHPPGPAEGGPYELPARRAVQLALDHRLDLRIARGEIVDAQRQVAVTANALQTGLTLSGDARVGQSRGISATEQDNVKFRPEHGLYTAGLLLDLPLERTAERNAYRNSYITLQQTVRNFQELEDDIKLDIRNGLRNLVEYRESYRIQQQAVRLARRRVSSTELFLQAGRAEIRDVLEAQESLVNAQNQRTAALVNYRVAELQLQRDMGVLDVSPQGLWTESILDEHD